jgi:HK97 family phage major capsid protein
MTGSGAGQPLGVFTASNDGIPTSRDVATGNAATYPTLDGLIEAKYALKGGYWQRAAWIFHRDIVKLIAKLKDGEGRPALELASTPGMPDRLLGLPLYVSEYAPNTATSALYVGIVGDFSYYWLAEALQFELQRLDELYAETNQVGFIGRLEADGMPVLAEAFARVKLG